MSVRDRVMAALEATVARRLDEVEDWQHQQRIARAVLDALNLRTEYGWAPDGDASEVIESTHPDVSKREPWVRQRVVQYGGSVFVRDVTEWRQEP